MDCGVYEHQPGYGGVCKVCGAEVMTPVDENGDAVNTELLEVWEQMFDLEMGVMGNMTAHESRKGFVELAKELTEDQAAGYQKYRLAKLGWE